MTAQTKAAKTLRKARSEFSAVSGSAALSLPEDGPRVRVVRQLKQWIADGVLTPGQMLPSERSLARQFEVSNRTISSALTMLVSEGVLRNGDGHARFVANQTQQPQLLNRAIVVVTIFPEAPASRHQQSGWVEHIGHGAVAAVQAAGRPAVALAPEQLDKAHIEALVAECPSGVILTDILMPAAQVLHLAQTLRDSGIPVVIYGDAPEFSQFDRVAPDHRHGGYLLAQWLAEQGCRRVLQMWPAPPDTYWVPHREDGYAEALCKAGLERMPPVVVPPVAPTSNSIEFENERRMMAGRLVEYLTGTDAVDAIMTCTDRETFAVAAACRLFGKEPGRDVLIAGYDNFWAECEERQVEASIPAATVDKCNHTTGKALAELLLERITGKLPPEPQLRMVAPQIIIPAE